MVAIILIFLPFIICNEIDFTDIFNYDHSHKAKHKNHPETISNIESSHSVTDYIPPKCPDPIEDKICEANFRRYISAILRYLETNNCVSSNSYGNYLSNYKNCKIVMSISQKDVETFTKYLAQHEKDQNKSEFKGVPYKIPDLIEIMIKSLSNYNKESGKTAIYKNWTKDIFGISFQTIVLALLGYTIIVQMMLMIKISISKLLLGLTIASFFISVPWTWLHLYKIAVAKKQTDLMKPNTCLIEPKSLGFFGSLVKFITQIFVIPEPSKDKCLQYQEAIYIDPFWEITPTYALAVTFTKFILEPFHHIGHTFNTVFKTMFGGLPIHVVCLILLFMTLIFLCLLLMTFGYKLRLPYFFATLEPSGPQNRLFSGANHSISVADSTQLTPQTPAATTGQLENGRASKNLPRPNIEKSPKFDEWADCHGEEGEIFYALPTSSPKVYSSKKYAQLSLVRTVGHMSGKRRSHRCYSSLTDAKSTKKYTGAAAILCTPPQHIQLHQLIDRRKDDRSKKWATPPKSSPRDKGGDSSSSSSIRSISPHTPQKAPSPLCHVTERGGGDYDPPAPPKTIEEKNPTLL